MRPISSYAAIGDGRTVALVAGDGSIDWLPLPELDSPSVFSAMLDAERGGRFALAPEAPYAFERRYLAGTNVLETVFSTDAGTVRVTDALTVPAGGLGPLRELARRVEGLAGSVPMAWSVEPRFGYAGATSRFGWRARVPVATAGGDALAVCAFEAGAPELAGGTIRGRFEARAGTRALLALCAAHREPLVVPTRDEVEARLDATAAIWRRWSDGLTYAGPFREAVLRSALALKLLVHAPSGAVAAAATTSLPEEVGGRAQLGLPLLLGARFGVHAQRVPGTQLRAGGARVLLVADARLPAHPPAASGPLPARRRRACARADAAAGRLPRLAPGAGRQRRGRAASARHLRRAAPDRVALREHRSSDRRRHRPPAGRGRRLRLPDLAANPTRESGRCEASRGTSPSRR